MKLAVKFQSQNEMNETLPAYWPWKKIEIEDSEQADYEAQGFTVYAQSAFDQYLVDNKSKLDNFALANMATSPKYLDISIEKKIDFANDLIGRLKKRNISQGINGVQGLWMHQRVRQLNVTLPGAPTFSVDLMNMVISGDLELACLSLMYSPPDDMSLPFHWLSADRMAWIVAELKKFLGWA